jgi:tRNA threonylcarbamoyladenosine biosynthesis protein TsaE
MGVPRLFAYVVTGLALVAAILFGAGAQAHPHVWITTRCAFVFDEQGRAVGLFETWTFDEMYSALAVMGIRREHWKDPAALTPLASSVVAGSRNDSQFTTLTLAGATIPHSAPREVGGEWKDEKLSIRFRLDFLTPVRPETGRPLRVEVRDPDLYADFRFDRALQSDGLAPGCAVRLDDPEAALPADPEARANALISGPILMLTPAIELECAS